MSANPDNVPDTYLRCYPRDSDGRTEMIEDQSEEVLCGDGVTDTWKASNCRHVIVANKTFVGEPSENDIDVVRGSDVIIGPNLHISKPGVSSITAKGGIDGLLIRGSFGVAEIGQFSIYDKWLKGPKVRRIAFSNDAKGSVWLLWAERPENVPPGVTIRKVPLFAVAAYFLYRSFVVTAYSLFKSLKKHFSNA